ncbi:MAG: hypothetical protein HZC29_08935 [Thaumarchaeota archaeon]|nr:hypothetical protein [Nitrososphaerota archaeon]
MSQELPVLKKGSFYLIRDSPDNIIMEDRTKRGLTVREHSLDDTYKVLADKGMIHDMDGIGHWVGIRWYFPKKDYDLNMVLEHAEKMEKKYTELRELTCPDDSE